MVTFAVYHLLTFCRYFIIVFCLQWHLLLKLLFPLNWALNCKFVLVSFPKVLFPFLDNEDRSICYIFYWRQHLDIMVPQNLKIKGKSDYIIGQLVLFAIEPNPNKYIIIE